MNLTPLDFHALNSSEPMLKRLSKSLTPAQEISPLIFSFSEALIAHVPPPLLWPIKNIIFK